MEDYYPEYLVDWTVRKPTPEEGFFFEDESMFWETTGGPGYLSAYIISGEVGPRDWGRLAEFTFTVDYDGALPEAGAILFRERGLLDVERRRRRAAYRFRKPAV